MYLASWSGGKDSCFACYLAIKKGMTVSGLVHFDRPNNPHGVDTALIRLQAELAGIPMVQGRITSEDFESEFKDTVTKLRDDGVRGMVFGDIYLEPHLEWVERVCKELGVRRHHQERGPWTTGGPGHGVEPDAGRTGHPARSEGGRRALNKT